MDLDAKKVFCQKEMEVGWGDCDAAGITYYAKYFDWFSYGRIELFKKIGLPYLACFHEQGISLVTVEALCFYKQSLKPEQGIVLETWLSGLTRARMEFRYRVFRKEDGVLAAEGMTAHAYVDAKIKPFDLKKRYPTLWEKLSLAALKD